MSGSKTCGTLDTAMKLFVILIVEYLMKSKANIKGHPLHPILVSFPITFFTGTFLADMAYGITDNTTYSDIAYYMHIAGIFTAPLTAIPGLLDYFLIVPPNSSGKKRATKHGITNTGMILIFIGALLARQNTGVSLVTLLIIEAIGLAVMITAAWWGGTLIYRNQIAVDHRYANAGKWKEEFIKSSRNLIELSGLENLKTDQMKLFHINDKRIAVARTETGYVAFDDRCTHRGGPLADGVMICGTVQCPWHGSQFDASSGQVKAGPAKEVIKTYGIINKEGKYFLQFI